VFGDPIYEPANCPRWLALAAAQAGINQPLGLTVYCWRIRLDQFA
jgi:hypothetical protein